MSDSINVMVERVLDALDRAYGGDLGEYLGEDWRDVLRIALFSVMENKSNLENVNG